MSGAVAPGDNEFHDVVQMAVASGASPPKLRRKWVNADVDGTHVSGVAWGKGSPELVLLHGAGESARRYDRVGLATTRPLVAIDLPGHGQSSWRRDGRYRPEQLAGPLAAAIRSFAPGAKAVVGTGLGGLAAIAVAVRHPLQVRNLVLVDTVPSVDPAGGVPTDLPESFATKEELLSLAPRLSASAGRSELILRS
ncbi:MAG TPA: alpha/beta hydrolase, partial [Acidimicrobiales bacterium]|nr:alpha/beta hydrolase [Acidimicrobiales bacterium]